ncbi:hypothetical protein ACVWWR_002704 [Bradyrhizobium sp. LM3.2]
MVFVAENRDDHDVRVGVAVRCFPDQVDAAAVG